MKFLCSFFFYFVLSVMLAQQTTLINNVEIFNGKDKDTYNANVLIVDNSIQKISKSPIKTNKSGKTTIINGEGKFLMSGLIDAHYHTMFASLPQMVLLTSDIGFVSLAAAKHADEKIILLMKTGKLYKNKL